jgi:threonine dehydratase
MADTADVKTENGFDLAIVHAARERIAPWVRRTPIIPMTPSGIGLKAESLHPTGAFKIRGAFNAILSLSDAERARGVVAHSSGNHAQAVSYAAAKLGVKAVIVMPSDAPTSKLEGTRRWGAEVIIVGPASAERTRKAEELAAEHGYTAVPPYDAWPIIAGTGTIALEILEDQPDVEAVFAPLSGGGLMGGLAATLKALKPSIKVIGVEPEIAADGYESFKAGRLVSLPGEQMAKTLADGLRVQHLGRLNWPLFRDYVDDVVTVSEAAIRTTMARIAAEARLVAEASGAVAPAGALAYDIAPDRCVAILSGGNVDLSLLAQVTAENG